MRHRKRKQIVETVKVPEGWIEETPGVYVAQELIPLPSEELKTLARKVEEVEGLLEKIDDKDYLIYWADEDFSKSEEFLKAEAANTKTWRSGMLVQDRVESIDPSEFDLDKEGVDDGNEGV